MKTKRFIALVLALGMLALVCSGCGGSGSKTTASETGSGMTDSTAENVNAPAAVQGSEKSDESSEPTSAESTAEEIHLPISEEPVTITVWDTANPGALQYCSTMNDIPAWQESFERTNIYFDSTLVAGNVGNEAFSLMAASGDYTDVVGSVQQFYSTGVSGAYHDGIIIDLKPYVDEYVSNFLRALEKCNFTKNALTDDGMLLAFVDLVEKKYAETGYALRKDWLDELNMDAPQTYDELHEVLTAMKNRFGGMMTLPESGLNGTNELISGFGVSVLRTENDPQLSYIIEDGKVVPCRTSEGFREYLTLMHEWYAEGLIWPDFVSSEVQQAISTRPGAGLDAVINDVVGYFPAESEAVDSIASMSSNPEFALVGVEEPTRTRDETISAKPEMRYGQIDWTISTQCPEDLIPYICQYVNYMYSDEGSLLCNFGIEGLTFEYDENGKPVFTDLLMNDPEGRDFRTLDGVYLVGGLFFCSAEKLDATTSEAAIDTATVWRKDIVDSIVPSEYMAMTADESTEYYAKYNDIATYFNESVLQFIIGTMDPDGSDWDNYVATMNQMGYEELTPIIQNMYDRYITR